MRLTFFLVAALASTAAHADWSPVPRVNDNVVTVSYNGGSVSYSESNTNYDGRLRPFVYDMLAIRPALEANLNSVVGAAVAQNGVAFQGGSLIGNLHARIQPAAPGTLLLGIDGIGYQARSKYSGKKYGISFSCTNTFSANNLSLTGQYGANDGVLLPSVGVTSNVDSSTDCDSNLEWMLPVVGNLLVNKVTGIIDSKLEDGVRTAMNSVKGKLLYVPDPAYGIGLLRLVPQTLQITTADGRTVNIGQIIANNMTYLLGNSQVDVQFGQGLNLLVVPGTSQPRNSVFDENVVTLTVTSPSLTFAVKLSQHAIVDWQWRCVPKTPGGFCPEP